MSMIRILDAYDVNTHEHPVLNSKLKLYDNKMNKKKEMHLCTINHEILVDIVIATINFLSFECYFLNFINEILLDAH